MSALPNTCVKIYNRAGSTLRHQLDNYVDDLKVKQILTSQVGNFRFTVPSQQGSDPAYLFNDVVIADKVYIWIKDGVINTAVDTPRIVGHVNTIQGMSSKDAVVKLIGGLDLGEVLLQQVAFQKHYVGQDIHTIVDDICDALGLGKTKVDACATTMNLDADAKTYFDILKEVSDHWYAAGSKVMKDFWVDKDLDLDWKARPVRSVGVESLLYGRDFVNYSLITDGSGIKNRIYVFGKKEEYSPKDPVHTIGRTTPANGDDWTYDAHWTANAGTISQDVTNPKVGADCVRCTADASGNTEFYFPFFTHGGIVACDGLHGYNYVEFWYLRHGMPANRTVQIYCPGSGDRIERAFPDGPANDVWAYNIFSIGENQLYDAVLNPTGEWTKVGSPDLRKMEQINFIVNAHVTPNTDYDQVDGLKFSFGRWRYTADSAASQALYGIRELVHIDEDLKSDTMCAYRGETLLYLNKDPVKRLDVQLQGPLDVLCGDRIPITLPPENLSATDFDVVSCEQIVSKAQGYMNTASLLDVSEHRTLPSNSFAEVVVHELRRLSDIARGVKTVCK